VAVVREWVGHVDDEVIKLYTHVHDHASQAAMQRLSNATEGHEGELTQEGTDRESAQP
jgi:hypothetical protein